MDAVVDDDGCLDGAVKTAQVLDESSINEGAVFAVEAMGEVFVVRVKYGNDLVSIFSLKRLIRNLITSDAVNITISYFSWQSSRNSIKNGLNDA